jgi:hypothetical protein
MPPVTGFTVVARQEFNATLNADIVAAPKSVAGIGWSAPTGWIASGDELAVGSPRLSALVTHLDRALRPAADSRAFWLLCCTMDGWRERIPYADDYFWVDPEPGLDEQVEWRGAPGALPRLSPTREWIACFSAHHNDPSAVLVPEPHYLMNHWYRPLRVRTEAARMPWVLRRNRASYAGSAHDSGSPETPGPRLRRQLKAMAECGEIDADVALEQRMSRRQQLHNKYVFDIDGFARTWDAWAWKMLSGSVVLSPSSWWETTFTRAFTPWEHFVPVAADLSDVATRLEWCRANDEECHAMARRARRRALGVYDRRRVERDTAERLRPLLGL